MSKGPERLRLDAALDQADAFTVRWNGALDWKAANDRLEEVVLALRRAAEDGLSIGGQTGPAMFNAMRRSADNLEERVTLFRRGQDALDQASAAITAITIQRDQIDSDPATAPLMDPGSFSDNPEWDDEKRMSEQGKHNAAVSAFQEREALREQRAREIAEEFDRRYEEPIAVMKSIHGLPDPEEPGGQDGPGGGNGPGARAPIPGGRGPSGPSGTSYQGSVIGQPIDVDGGNNGETNQPTIEPPVVEPPIVQPPVVEPPTTNPTTNPTGPSTVGPTGPGGTGLVPGGVGTAVGVGLGGGALLGGLAKGVGIVRGIGAGVLAPGQQTRPLGGLSRSAVSGTLGRGAVAGAPASARPAARGGVGAASAAGRTTGAAGRGTAAAGAGGRGTGARTGAVAGGARGGAAGAGAARRRGRGDDAADREHYDDGQDWLDDEAAPGVLD